MYDYVKVDKRKDSRFSSCAEAYYIRNKDILFGTRIIGALTVSNFGDDLNKVIKIQGWRTSNTNGFEIVSDGKSIEDIAEVVKDVIVHYKSGRTFEGMVAN